MRWTNKQGNLHIKDDRGQKLTLWRSIAQSHNDIQFREVVENMKLTDAWLRNPKAQEYFKKTFLLKKSELIDSLKMNLISKFQQIME